MADIIAFMLFVPGVI